MMQILGLKVEEIREFPFNVNFFKDHGLYTPLVKLHGGVSKFVRMGFPDIMSSVRFPERGSRWAPLPWRGKITEIASEVMEGGGMWPEGFWTRKGYFHRARIVDQYLRSHRGINLEGLDDIEASSLKMEDVRRILYD